jgi:uncharacterized membrane protein (DUF373 family)
MWNMGKAGRAIDAGTNRLFGRLADVIVRLLVPLAIAALVIGVARVFLDLLQVWKAPSITVGFDTLVTDILSMFVVIELLKSIVEYFEAHRLRLTLILDAAIVFLVREVMIGLYGHEMEAGLLAAIAGLLLVIGVLRIAAARLNPEVSGAPAAATP